MHVGVKQAVTPEIVAKAAAELMGGPPGGVVELMPRGTLRSFRVDGATPLTIRVDEDPAGRRVDVEAKAFVALQTATSPAIVPTLRTRHVLFGRDGIERRYLAYDWIDGRVLEAPLPLRPYALSLVWHPRLDADPALAVAWQALTPGRRRSHVLYVSGAKQAATRARRAATSAALVMQGLGYDERP